MIISRNLGLDLLRSAEQFPVLTLTGPRQSGKTTLVRSLFQNHAYVSLEAPDERASAKRDPRGFLSSYFGGAIIDEIQYVPELVSYIQTFVDENPIPGSWILTGSENLTLSQSVSQSLAGRTSIAWLLPLTLDELRQVENYPKNLYDALYTGGFPRIYDEKLDPNKWFSSYIDTYIEKDVRTLRNIGDLTTFQDFIELCAGRSGTLVNYSALANDCGISQKTAKNWLSVLEASFIAFRLRAFHRNMRKKVVKMPKLFFYDSGLMCWLLGIREPKQIHTHPLRGQIFETWVVSEIIKHRVNSGERRGVYYYRDHNGAEVDLVIPGIEKVSLIEAKSAKISSPNLLRGTNRIRKHFGALNQQIETSVVYGGDQYKEISGSHLIPWRNLRYFGIDEEAVVSVSTSVPTKSDIKVMAIYPNNTFVDGSPDEHGVVRLQLHSLYMLKKVYVASEGLSARMITDWIPAERILHVQLHPLAEGGSVVTSKRRFQIPGIEGDLNPILDSLGRTYLYTDNIAVNGGKQCQPVPFDLGENLLLEDATGQKVYVRIVDISSQATLLEYVYTKTNRDS